MKMRFVKFVSIGMLCALCFTVKAQQKNAPSEMHTFTAKEAVDYAMSHAVQVKNAMLDIKIQEQTNKGITAMALPHLTGNVGVTDNLSLATQLIPAEFMGGTPGTFIPLKFGTKYNGTYGANLQQIIFDGQVFVGLQARKAAIKNSVLAADVTKEQIKTNVYKVYYQLAVAKRQIGTLDANIANYEKLLHDTKEIYKNGFAEKLDVNKVQVQLSNLETQKVRAQNQIDAGKEGLKFLMNIPQQDEIILSDTLSDEELKSGILEEDYKYEDRKEFQQLETSIELGQYNVKRYQLSKIPTISFSANLNRNAQRNNFDFFKGGEPWYTSSFLSLNLSIPIFDGGTRNSNIQTARLNLMKMNNQLDQLKSSIDNGVFQSRINMKSALITMDTQKKNIELAQQVYNSTRLKYEQGLGSNQEISTAQADLVTAQNNYYSSLYDAIIAKIDYLTAAGKL
ncbi:MAG: TolC family protein [Ginsengibacter sp.]